ncbi:MAG TPA: transcriptional coactivator p15/PC4 family protein [candidate division Zixibacteria bacterium]|nr:transcriptional coactivator p15/PC4 family protein [candidate division Zixibacteria bacterium]MDD4917280.1 transcriptional coactivator p15/PC4 family protein [candidate division Zixibacteria bacterium]MDM7973482.1 transcriptional coactivator p15/PC4 family protein [candidate division Zixibacteria bacterium]HOD65434.1 transcriptional coactivator p15/PC4 family protein [candidate division Zixibacteria bacterium]HOZ07475.1 transcriptional coactivator p15/PC4 family protein [candidate division Z
MRFELDKNATERVVIEDSEYKGHHLVQLRIYFLADDSQWLPTKKGVSFRRDQLDEVIDALQKIKAGG